MDTGTAGPGLSCANRCWRANVRVQGQCTAPHKTYGKGYFDFYITKDGWADTNEILSWDSLEDTPFCRYLGESDRNMLKTEIFSCTVPQKAGKHVIYTVWQRDDSPEAFYSCSDVIFAGSSVSASSPDGNGPENSESESDVLPQSPNASAPQTPQLPNDTEDDTLPQTPVSSSFTLFHQNHIHLADSQTCVTRTAFSTHLTTSSCGRDDTFQQFFAHNGLQVRDQANECWQVVSSRGRQFLNVVT